MEANRKGWTAQRMDITDRSLHGDVEEGEEVVHSILQPPQRARTSWWPRFFVYNPAGIEDSNFKYNPFRLKVKQNGRTFSYYHGQTFMFVFTAIALR